MRQPIKLIIRKGKVRKDGKSLIFLQYCHTAERRILIGTDIAIPPKYWDKRSCRISRDLPEEYGIVENIETILTEKLRKAEDMISHARTKRNVCPMQFLKNNFPLANHWQIEQMPDEKNKQDVFYQIDQYIKEKGDHVRHCTISIIQTMKVHLKVLNHTEKFQSRLTALIFIFMKNSCTT